MAGKKSAGEALPGGKERASCYRTSDLRNLTGLTLQSVNEIDDGEAGQGCFYRAALTDAVMYLHGHQSPFDAFCRALPGALINSKICE